MCISEAATRHRGFRPAYCETLFGTGVSDGFRERLCSVFSQYYGVKPEDISERLDAWVSEAADAGEDVSDALGSFVVCLLELDL